MMLLRFGILLACLFVSICLDSGTCIFALIKQLLAFLNQFGSSLLPVFFFFFFSPVKCNMDVMETYRYTDTDWM